MVKIQGQMSVTSPPDIHMEYQFKVKTGTWYSGYVQT